MVRRDGGTREGSARIRCPQPGGASAPALMLILFDHGTPAPLRSFLKGHTVRETKGQGWDTFGNGELLTAAEAAGFEVLVTTDKNLRYQQNLTGRKIGVVVLGNAQWP